MVAEKTAINLRPMYLSTTIGKIVDLLLTSEQKIFSLPPSEKEFYVMAGKIQVAIVRALQHFNVNKSLLSPTIVRYNVTYSSVLWQKLDEKEHNTIGNDSESEKVTDNMANGW